MGVLVVVLTKKGVLFKEKKKRGRKVLIVRLNEVHSFSFTSKFGTRHTQKMHMAGTI